MGEIPEKTEEQTEKLVKPVVSPGKEIPKNMLLAGAVVVVLAGVATGFILSKKQVSLPLVGGQPKMIKTEKMAGSTDTKVFKDVAEGTLEKGGIDGEGTHKLIRPGQESQPVYLTSSLVSLDDYVGKKIRVWGETFAAQKAGWLMDVGRVEVLE